MFFLIGLAPSSSSMTNQESIQKKDLIGVIRKAADASINIDRVEDYVGIPPLLSTRIGAGREVLRVADIAPDTDYQAKIPDLTKAMDVAYWQHQIEHSDVKIVGLVWREDGSVEVFYGIVLPP